LGIWPALARTGLLAAAGAATAEMNAIIFNLELHGDWQPALPMGGLKALDSSLYLCRSHVP
jgi:hypothetical protein